MPTNDFSATFHITTFFRRIRLNMVATSLFVGVLLAAAAFAAPSSVVESRTHRRRSMILDRTSTKSGSNGTSNVDYSNNVCYWYLHGTYSLRP